MSTDALELNTSTLIGMVTGIDVSVVSDIARIGIILVTMPPQSRSGSKTKLFLDGRHS